MKILAVNISRKVGKDILNQTKCCWKIKLKTVQDFQPDYVIGVTRGEIVKQHGETACFEFVNAFKSNDLGRIKFELKECSGTEIKEVCASLKKEKLKYFTIKRIQTN